MLFKVTAIQSRLGQKLTLEEKLHIFRQKPDFICLPEYCMVTDSDSNHSRAALRIKENLEYLKNLSVEFSACLVAGTVVEGENDSLFNSSYIFDDGNLVGRYRKLNPLDGELKKGILPGDRIFTAVVNGVRISVLICADALNPELFELLRREDVDLIFIPTASPYLPAESKAQKHKRDNDIFLEAARRSSAYVIKVCGVGSLFQKPLQGRSLIVSPWGFINRVPIYAEAEPTMLAAILDVDELREFRHKKKTCALSDSKSPN